MPADIHVETKTNTLNSQVQNVPYKYSMLREAQTGEGGDGGVLGDFRKGAFGGGKE